MLKNKPPELVNGKRCCTLNGISYQAPATPLKLADHFNLNGVFKLDFPERQMNRTPKLDATIINGTYKGFMEIILQNNDTTVRSYHMDGYAFFIVGMDYGESTEHSKMICLHRYMKMKQATGIAVRDPFF